MVSFKNLKASSSFFFITLLTAAVILSVVVIKNTSSTKARNASAKCSENSMRCNKDTNGSFTEKCSNGKWVLEQTCDYEESCTSSDDVAQCKI